jgi:hypothetical protein
MSWALQARWQWNKKTRADHVSSWIFILIESEDDTERLGIFWFLSQTYYNAMPTQGGWGYIFIGLLGLLASQAYVEF